MTTDEKKRMDSHQELVDYDERKNKRPQVPMHFADLACIVMEWQVDDQKKSGIQRDLWVGTQPNHDESW